MTEISNLMMCEIVRVKEIYKATFGNLELQIRPILIC